MVRKRKDEYGDLLLGTADTGDIFQGTSGTAYEPYIPAYRPKPVKPEYHAPEAFKPVAPDRGPYQSPWQADIDKILDDIRNRKPFNFDINGDAVFQSLKDQAIVGGKRAMADTLAKASAATGGMNSSYGQAVAQQAYQGYLQDLNGHVPALAQAAEARYERQGADMKDRLALYMGMDHDAYGKHRDQVADDRYANDQAYRKWLEAKEDAWRKYQQEYGQYRDQVADNRYHDQLDYDRWRDEQSMSAGEKKDAYNRLYDMIVNHGYQPSQEEMDYAGMGQGEVDSLLSSWQQAQYDRAAARAPRYYGGGSGKGSGGGTDYDDSATDDDGLYFGPDIGQAFGEDYANLLQEVQSYVAAGSSVQEINDFLNSAVHAGYITADDKKRIMVEVGMYGQAR